MHVGNSWYLLFRHFNLHSFSSLSFRCFSSIFVSNSLDKLTAGTVVLDIFYSIFIMVAASIKRMASGQVLHIIIIIIINGWIFIPY